MKVYQTNKNLTNFSLWHCNIAQNGGDQIIANTFRNCINLKYVFLSCCGINDEQIVTIFEAIRGHTSLVDLSLTDNAIGNRACETIAALLEDPHCNLCLLNLYNNEIDIEGATIIANSLANNTNLKRLILGHNPIDQSSLLEVLSKAVCNTTSINSTYSSNHTLEDKDMNYTGAHLASVLRMNNSANKSHVAIKKILQYHPFIDMEPLFNLDGENNLKALPYAVDWFERAKIAVAEERRGYYYNVDQNMISAIHIDQRKLSAIYQFARAMPLLFVPSLPDMLLLHMNARDQLEKEKMETERQIAIMLKAKEELEHKLKAKDGTIEKIRHLVHDAGKKRKCSA